MACFHPLKAVRRSGRVVVLGAADGKLSQLDNGRDAFELPCGQCVGCRLERSRQWAMRCVHESQMHEHSVFVTLTYDDEHVPGRSLVYRDFQLFMKRLRKAKGRVRFYMCGEYGENFGRPHFHACLFGCFFEDRVHFRSLPSGSSIYTSEELSKIWKNGFASIGDVTFESAAYIARYVMKKVTGDAADMHYVDGDTGEVLEPEFNSMSLKPGIGAGWFERFRSDVFGRDGAFDRVVMRGIEMKPPKYYDKLLEKADSFAKEYVSFQRYVRSCEDGFQEDTTPERLAVRESVAKARLNFKKRSIA